MKKLILISVLAGVLPLASMAQDDDLYFSKKSSSNSSSYEYNNSRSNRSVDDYNNRYRSSYQNIDNDSTGDDVISFSGRGVYPKDSMNNVGDYNLTRQMSRFDGYIGCSPYYGWYDPWYYDSFYYGYGYGYPYYGWRVGWGYDPWYYGGGYYGDYYGGYYGWYNPW